MKTDPRIVALWPLLDKEYPQRESMLDYHNPFELLAGVCLSAQTTDAGVNKVLPELFRRWPDPAAMAAAPLEELEKLLHPLGFFRQKARNLRSAAGMLLENHAGRVPQEMEALTALPGLGRKSANVIRWHIWGLPGIIVDTHFGRVCRRLGLTAAKDAVKVEKEIQALLSEKLWGDFSMTVNLHGRRYCQAKTPRCSECPLAPHCPLGRGEVAP